jgi:hypothetical protein
MLVEYPREAVSRVSGIVETIMVETIIIIRNG